MSNVVISGYYGSRNAGDEAMLAAMLEVFSDMDPKVNITVISSNPEDTTSRHGVRSIGWLDFPAIYGQLKDVTFKEGDSVEAGHVIGFVKEPTKYYVKEGANVFFQLKKDGKPVDPKDYFH